MNEMLKSMAVAASGLQAQGTRLRVISENLANAGSTADVPGGDPYRRKTVSFAAELDKAVGAEKVKVKRVGADPSPFRQIYEPSHPAADTNGNVKLSNVNMLIELADMREAQRSYEANLQMIEQARSMLMRTIELLRS
jgi:flagellar basal-body rod protein FlgC